MLETAGFSRVSHPRIPAHSRRRFPQRSRPRGQPRVSPHSQAAIAEAKKQGADLVVASDPDADRIGVAVPLSRDPHGDWTTLDGNQIGVVLSAFVMKECRGTGAAPARPLLWSRPSCPTQMARAVARREGVRVEDDLLVGFKWIAKRDRRSRAPRASCSPLKSRTDT